MGEKDSFVLEFTKSLTNVNQLGLWAGEFFDLPCDLIKHFKQASRGPLHKAAVSGQYGTVKILLESGDDVDQTDQVYVLSGLFNSYVKPDLSRSLHLHILLSFSYIGCDALMQ